MRPGHKCSGDRFLLRCFLGLPSEAWSIRVALGELYLNQGDPQQAHKNFMQAATIMHLLADAPGDEKQRITFLASPFVETALEQDTRRG
ncbi:MAG TPA: hypothetical protein VJ761_05215 [Ktedonobacteraceae bacterium]|nr:hypothetical protein [Ktedonobacteraceae bacterium]